jgi:hypothetical protein
MTRLLYSGPRPEPRAEIDLTCLIGGMTTGAEIARRVFCEPGMKRVPAMSCWARAYLDLRAGRSPRATSAVQLAYRLGGLGEPEAGDEGRDIIKGSRVDPRRRDRGQWQQQLMTIILRGGKVVGENGKPRMDYEA